MGHNHSVHDSDAHFTINPITRQIRNDGSKKVTLIQGDHNSERFTFELPRYIEGHDMSQCNKVEVHFLNIDNATKEKISGVYTVDDLKVSTDKPDMVQCSWLISQNATQYVGNLNFLLKLACVEGDIVQYAWHTAVCVGISVSDGINGGEALEEDYLDIIEQWKATVIRDITNDVNAGVSEWAEIESGKLRGMVYTETAKTNEAIAVERARIDMMQSSATADDAEIIDGRIDHTGGIWSNLGNHIRNTADMNSIIRGAVNFKTLKIDTTIINGWVDVSGAYISNASSGDSHKCVQIPVNPGEHYLIYSEYGWSMPDAVAQKADGSLIRIYHTANSRSVNNFDAVITIPDGAAKLTVNCMSENVKPLTVAKITGATSPIDVDYIKNALSSVKDDKATLSENLITSVKTAYGLKFGQEFVVESGDTQFSIGECVVEPGKVYLVKAGASFMSNPYVFYDEHGLIIGDPLIAPISGYQTYDVELMAPPGAVLLKVGQYGGMWPGVYEVTGYTVPKPWDGLKWACVGDSLTEENIRTTLHYFDYITEKTGITTVNMGVGGTGYKRGEDANNAFYQRIREVPNDVDVVTIFGSGNDLTHINRLGLPTDVGTDTICGCINHTIDQLYSVLPTVQVGIISPTPWVYNEPSDNGSMAEYTNALKEICIMRGIPFLDLFHCSGFRPNDENYRNLVFSKDDGNGVHPNELGHKIIASHIKVFLETLII